MVESWALCSKQEGKLTTTMLCMKIHNKLDFVLVNFNMCDKCLLSCATFEKASLIARFMRPTWGPPGADRSQVGPMLAPWILLSGIFYTMDLSISVMSIASDHFYLYTTCRFVSFIHFIPEQKKCYNEIKRLAKIILGWTVPLTTLVPDSPD